MDDTGLYFRTRENGAAVFRIAGQGRSGRVDMDQIATVNIRNGETKPQNAADISEVEQAEIDAWIDARRAELARRAVDDLFRLSDRLSMTAHWVQSRAKPEDLDGIGDQLLASMNDLRRAIVRLKSEKIDKSPD